jgi:hypothetical protein
MADIGWARAIGRFAGEKGLRRGEWYKVLEDEKADWLLLEVNKMAVRITRECLRVRHDAPKTWSVVRLTPEEAAVEAAKHGHVNDEQHRTHLVCPGCHTRHHVAGQPKDIKCSKCGQTYPVDWTDRA